MSLVRLAALAPLAVLAHAAPAAAESAPPPRDQCDLHDLPLGVAETVPSGCVLTVYDHTATAPGLGWREAAVPTVIAHDADGGWIPAPIAVARSTTRLPVDRYEWCDLDSCSNRSWEGDLDGVRFDIVFLAPLAAGTVVDVHSDVGPGKTVLVVEPAACPAPVVPLVSCMLAACEGSCQPRQPLCDAGPWDPPGRDAGYPEPYPYPDDIGNDDPVALPGCNASSGAAAPTVLLALAVAFAVRRMRRRAGSPAAS